MSMLLYQPHENGYWMKIAKKVSSTVPNIQYKNKSSNPKTYKKKRREAQTAWGLGTWQDLHGLLWEKILEDCKFGFLKNYHYTPSGLSKLQGQRWKKGWIGWVPRALIQHQLLAKDRLCVHCNTGNKVWYLCALRTTSN